MCTLISYKQMQTYKNKCCCKMRHCIGCLGRPRDSHLTMSYNTLYSSAQLYYTKIIVSKDIYNDANSVSSYSTSARTNAYQAVRYIGLPVNTAARQYGVPSSKLSDMSLHVTTHLITRSNHNMLVLISAVASNNY